jgi:hypothetical protein
MDQFRAMAYLDILNGITAEARIACGQPPDSLGAPNDDGPNGDTVAPDSAADPDDGPVNGPDDEDPSGSGGPGGPDPGGAPRSPGGPSGTAAPPPPWLPDLLLPLSTLLGLAERPGEGHRLGPLDPDLCRALALAAAASPDSRLCMTVTDPDGIAVGHGCARGPRHGRGPAGPEPFRPHASSGRAPLPARVNLTVTTDLLTELARATGPPGRARWTFTQDTDQGSPGGFGTWTLMLPDGETLTVELRPVPTFDCDHQHESHAYQPNDTLRHLVQVRDYECTFPTCSRHARESDFEHGAP